MKQCGPLPDVMIPFAERMFAWFPEVLVALGHPTLQDQFALPPHPGVQMTLEETAEHKLILVKLIRRQRRRIVAPCNVEEGDSPFSKSRANAAAQTLARQAAATRSVAMDIRPESQVIQQHKSVNQKSPPRVVNDAYIPVKQTTRSYNESLGSTEHAPKHQVPEELVPVDREHNTLMKSKTYLGVDPEENQHREQLAKQQHRQADRQAQLAQESQQEQHQWVLKIQQQVANHQDRQQQLQQQQQPHPQQRHQKQHTPEMGQLPGQNNLRDYQSIDLERKFSDSENEEPRRLSCPAQIEKIEGSFQGPKVSAAAARLTAKKKVMGKSDADPGSPKLSSPGSHNPWGSERSDLQSLPHLQLPEASLHSSLSTPEPQEVAVGTQLPPRRMSGDTSRPPRSEPMPFAATIGQDIANPLALERSHTWSNPLAVPPSPPVSEGNFGDDRFPGSLTPTPKGTSPQVPLASRRNLQLQNHWSSRSDRGGHKTSSVSREIDTPKGTRVLPCPFPHCQTLFFFDWDDTLCPTTWIRDQLKSHIADSMEWSDMKREDYEMDWRDKIPAWFAQPLPDIPDIRDKIASLQKAAIKVISIAQSLGVVCIVTNAVEGWVDKTIRKWLPQLGEYISGHGSRPSIEVLYGQVEYKKVRPKPGTPAGELPTVDNYDFSELMLWKKVAMSNALRRLDELYRMAPASTPVDDKSVTSRRASNNLLNIVSIGDSEFEMVSGELVTLDYQDLDTGNVTTPSDRPRRPQSAPPSRHLRVRPSCELGILQEPGETHTNLHGRPLFKAIKLQDAPKIDDIMKQLDWLTKSLSQVVAVRSHFRLEPEQLRTREWTAPVSSDGAEHPDVRVQRLLRTQTI